MGVPEKYRKYKDLSVYKSVLYEVDWEQVFELFKRHGKALWQKQDEWVRTIFKKDVDTDMTAFVVAVASYILGISAPASIRLAGVDIAPSSFLYIVKQHPDLLQMREKWKQAMLKTIWDFVLHYTAQKSPNDIEYFPITNYYRLYSIPTTTVYMWLMEDGITGSLEKDFVSYLLLYHDIITGNIWKKSWKVKRKEQKYRQLSDFIIAVLEGKDKGIGLEKKLGIDEKFYQDLYTIITYLAGYVEELLSKGRRVKAIAHHLGFDTTTAIYSIILKRRHIKQWRGSILKYLRAFYRVYGDNWQNFDWQSDATILLMEIIASYEKQFTM